MKIWLIDIQMRDRWDSRCEVFPCQLCQLLARRTLSLPEAAFIPWHETLHLQNRQRHPKSLFLFTLLLFPFRLPNNRKKKLSDKLARPTAQSPFCPTQQNTHRCEIPPQSVPEIRTGTCGVTSESRQLWPHRFPPCGEA